MILGVSLEKLLFQKLHLCLVIEGNKTNSRAGGKKKENQQNEGSPMKMFLKHIVLKSPGNII